MAKAKWRVIITRIGSGCRNCGEGRTISSAFVQALGRSSPYNTGISATTGESFGKDLTPAFWEGLAAARKLISGKRPTRASWTDHCANVEIIRI